MTAWSERRWGPVRYAGAGTAFVAFAAGFGVATALLHAVGVSLGLYLERGRAWIVRTAAVMVGASGVVMLAARL